MAGAEVPSAPIRTPDGMACLGGPRQLVERFVRDDRLPGWLVEPGEDATPPGHTAI